MADFRNRLSALLADRARVEVILSGPNVRGRLVDFDDQTLVIALDNDAGEKRIAYGDIIDVAEFTRPPGPL